MARNARAFGGDPDAVTVGGQDAGGVIAVDLGNLYNNQLYLYGLKIELGP